MGARPMFDVVGVGRYEPSDEEATAEAAFVLEDGYQGQGIGLVRPARSYAPCSPRTSLSSCFSA
jgi:hypothetical protein